MTLRRTMSIMIMPFSGGGSHSSDNLRVTSKRQIGGCGKRMLGLRDVV